MSVFLHKGRRKRHRNLQQTFDADIYSKNRRTDRHAFPTRPRARRTGSGSFFGGTHPTTTMMMLFFFSLSSGFEDDDDDSFSSTTANHRKRKKFLSRELESNFSTPAPLALLEEDVERKVSASSFESLFLSFCLLGCDADLLFSSSSSKYSRCVLRKHRNRSIGLDLTRRRM